MPVDYGRDAQAEFLKEGAPVQLVFVVGCSKGNVMNRAGRDVAERGFAALDQINLRVGRAWREREATTALFFADQFATEGDGEQLLG